MAVVHIDNGVLEVELTGLDKLWSLKSRLTIPLDHVRGATADPGIAREPKGIRGPGTHVPGFITAGTFHHDGDRTFWNVKHPERAIVIELRDESFQRLVIEVDQPAETVRRIEAAITPT